MPEASNREAHPDLDSLGDMEAKAIEIWEAMTEVKVDSRAYRLSVGGSSMNVYDANKRLLRAMELDNTGISTLLMFRHIYGAFIDQKSFTMREFLQAPQSVKADLDQVQSLYDCLHNEIVDPFLNGFIDRMRKAFTHYGVEERLSGDDRGYFEEIAGYIRLDALVAVKNLRKHAFLESADEADASQIKYSHQILKFWNINSLIRMSSSMPNGVTLCLIQEPDVSDSYFCFAVKNGGNFSILTDKQKWAYPGQSARKRNNRREFDRMGQYWFPYHLLNLAYDEESKRMHQTKKETGLVPYQMELAPIGNVADLDIEESSWIIMMFDLIKERYFHRNTKEELAYTGAMVVSEESLLEESKHLPITFDSQVVMPKLSVSSVLRDEMEAGGEEWEDKPFYHRWMETRYADKVTDDILVFLNQGHQLELLKDNEHHGQLVAVKSPKEPTVGMYRTPSYSIQQVSPTEFGSREELIKDIRWTARHNLARGIQKLANDEFEVEKGGIVQWYEDRFHQNLPELIKHLVSFDDEFFNRPSPDEPPQFAHRPGSRQRKVFRKLHSNTFAPFGMSSYGCFMATELDSDKRYFGWSDESKATLFFLVRVNNALDIPRITGVAYEDLPVFLKHYSMKGYNGNSLLDRLDPVDENVENPWDKLNLNVIVPMSKRTFHRLRKEMGLAKVTNFDEHFDTESGDF